MDKSVKTVNEEYAEDSFDLGDYNRRTAEARKKISRARNRSLFNFLSAVIVVLAFAAAALLFNLANRAIEVLRTTDHSGNKTEVIDIYNNDNTN